MVLVAGSCTYERKPMLDMELIIYPSGGGSYGYAVSIAKDTLTVTRNKLGVLNDDFVLTEVIEKSSIRLSEKELNRILQYLSNISEDKYRDEGAKLVFDSWIYVISINGQEVAVFSSSTLLKKLEKIELQELQGLVKYLMKISPIELKLEGFA